jgi:hypothetical protein
MFCCSRTAGHGCAFFRGAAQIRACLACDHHPDCGLPALLWCWKAAVEGCRKLSSGHFFASDWIDNAGHALSAGATISLLDAQRRTRQRADPSQQQQQGPGSAERRSWRAGRTPFHAGAASRFGRTQGLLQAGAVTEQQQAAASPLILPSGLSSGLSASALAAGPGPAVAGERPKGTTDTARRILATLESLDQAVAKGAGAGAAAAAAGTGSAAQEQPSVAAAAPPPPPTDSLGFAGKCVSAGLQKSERVGPIGLVAHPS